jgi:tetratricopeptide (TPR) repeat protein
MAPPAPPKPVMSAETRNFLGVFLLAVGLAGMLVFAIWALNMAYSSYVTAQTSGAAARYYEQGVKLHGKGDLSGAERQYQNAIAVSPKSKAASRARDALYKVWVAQAYSYSNSSDKEALLDIAKKMVDWRPKYPEGHYYLGLADELSGNTQKAAVEYDIAAQLAGNDVEGYGKAARDRRDRINAASPSSGGAQPSGGTEPKPAAPERTDNSGIPFVPGSSR